MKKLIGFVVGMFLMVGCSNPVSVPKSVNDTNQNFSCIPVTNDKELKSLVISNSTNLNDNWYTTSGNENNYTTSYRIYLDTSVGATNIIGIDFLLRATSENNWYFPGNENLKYNYSLTLHSESKENNYIEILIKSTATAFIRFNIPFRCVIFY